MATATVKFGADTKALQSGLDDASQKLDAFGARVYASFSNANASTASLGKQVESLATRSIDALRQSASGATSSAATISRGVLEIGGAAAAVSALVATALGAIAAQSVQFGTAIGHSAAQLGDTTENISQLVPVASAAGMSLDDLTKKFTTIGAKLDANDKSFQNAFKALKIDPSTFNAAGALDQMNMLNKAVSSLGDSYEKTAALQVLFGTDESRMEAVLNRSGAAFRALEQEAQRTGTVMTGSLIDGMRGTQSIVQQITDKFNEGKQAITGLAITAYGQLKPAIDAILEGFRSTVGSIVDFIEGINQATQKGQGLAPILKDIKDGLYWLSVGAVAAKETLSNLGGYFDTFENSVEKGVNVLRDFWHDVTTKGKAGQDITGGGAASFDRFTRQVSEDAAVMGDNLQTTFRKARASVDKLVNTPVSMPAMKGGAAGEMKAVDQDAISAARQRIQGQIEILQAGLEQKKAILDQEVALGKISEGQKVAATKAAIQQEYEAEVALLQKEAAIEGQKVAQREAILNKIAVLEVTHNTQMIEQTTEAAKKIYDAYNKAFQKIGNTISQGFMGMIQGTESLRQMMQKILLGIISDFISAGVKMVMQHAAQIATQVAQTIAGQTAQTGAVTAGVAARTAAQGAGAAASAAAGATGIMEQLVTDAKGVFGGVFSFLAPIMGPAAVGPATAASATVLGGIYDTGTWQLPSDQLAMVHRGEMIVPAAQTPWAQSLMANAAGSQGGGNHYHSHNWHTTVNNPTDGNAVVSAIKDRAHEVGRALARSMTSSGFRPRAA